MNLGQRRFGIPNSGLRLVCQPSENRLVDTKTCRRATAPGWAITRGLTESHHTAPNRRGQNESTFLDTATAILKPNGIATPTPLGLVLAVAFGPDGKLYFGNDKEII